MRALKVIEPEVEIVLTGVVLGESQLGPAHGPLEPRKSFGRGEGFGFG